MEQGYGFEGGYIQFRKNEERQRFEFEYISACDDTVVKVAEKDNSFWITIEMSDNTTRTMVLDTVTLRVKCDTGKLGIPRKKHNEKTLKEKLINFIQRRGK